VQNGNRQIRAQIPLFRRNFPNSFMLLCLSHSVGSLSLPAIPPFFLCCIPLLISAGRRSTNLNFLSQTLIQMLPFHQFPPSKFFLTTICRKQK
jgi:hypothetical protein